MNARKMFEDLGYTYYDNFNYIYYESDSLDIEMIAFTKFNPHIDFLRFHKGSYNNLLQLDKKLITAIICQIGELRYFNDLEVKDV